MKVRLIHRLLVLSLLTAIAVTSASCSRRMHGDGTDTEAKQNWDSLRSSEQSSILRNRMATTQRDN
jgi:hypothetical protein